MKFNLSNKISQRFKSDSFNIFCYRIVFFLFRKYLEIYDWILYQIRRLAIMKFRGSAIIKEIQGNKMFLDPGDTGLSKELLMAGIREPFHTRLMQDVLKRGDVVIDIGANIGYYVLMEAKLAGNEGKVYAIEPVTDNANLLKKNAKLNNYKNIDIFELAIGGEDKDGEICLTKKRNWCTMLDNKYNKNSAFYTDKKPVKILKLDTFIKDKRFPNIIRMDVEGYETEIIKGMENILKSGKPLKILMELHSSVLDDGGIGILKIFEHYGFKIRYFFRERPPLMLNKSSIIRKFYYFLGRKINGIYEFCYKDITADEIIKKELIINETFHVCFERK